MKLREPLGQWSIDGIMSHYKVTREIAVRLRKGEDIEIDNPATATPAETHEDDDNVGN